jgi:hypothetical protein
VSTASSPSRPSAPVTTFERIDASVIEAEPGSYRDRNGAVFYKGDRVLRRLSPRAEQNWKRLAREPFFLAAKADGRIVDTWDADPSETGLTEGVIEHARVPFISYPYEWSFGMLRRSRPI